jgi:prepilin peptidase CpaA
MDKYFLTCALAIATVGAITDLRDAHIPNWLTYTGLLAALVTRSTWGWHELQSGLAGLALTGGVFLVLFVLGAMGGGDLKLMAAVGAWAGPARSFAILNTAAIAGGVLALGYILYRRQVLVTLLNSFELVRHHVSSGLQPHPWLNVGETTTVRVPYGLAIALGTLVCTGNAFGWR